MKIYVAGPYTAKSFEEVEQNVQDAIDVGIEIIKLGHCPYIPHLTHFVELRAKEKGIRITYDEYLKIDFEWLSTCDGLLFLGLSPGTIKERTICKDLNLNVYYDIEEIKEETSRNDQIKHERKC